MTKEKIEQKQVYIVGLEATNYKNMRAVVLTPDLLSQKLIMVKGEIGAGKSSVLELVSMPLSGFDGIHKENLVNGFIDEIQISDGDLKIFLGAKMGQVARGENAGSQKFESLMYCKDNTGKHYQPIIDGKAATAATYAKEITTDLIFSLPDLFSSNATTHRKLLEKLFSEELGKLGVEKVVEKINKAKLVRDNRRSICDASGSFLETFKAEGWSEEDLQKLTPVDLEAMQKEIIALEVEKGSAKTSVDDKNELAKNAAQAVRDKALQKIKDDAVGVVGKIRVLTEKKRLDYTTAKTSFEEIDAELNCSADEIVSIGSEIQSATFLSDDDKKELKVAIQEKYVSFLGKERYKNVIEPVLPILIEIAEDGKPIIPEKYDEEYAPLVSERNELLKKYAELSAEELVYKKVDPTDTTEVDKKIEAANIKKSAGERTNRICERFGQWTSWMESKAEYESLVSELRRLYALINTGVEGLIISPIEAGNGVNIWLQYSGNYNKEFFGNKDGELRFLYDYSETQRGIIGIMLQAARLDLKEKCLRLCVVDSIPLTKIGIEVLSQLCEERNVQLITSYTDDSYDLDNLDDGEVIVENGSVFFNSVQNAK